MASALSIRISVSVRGNSGAKWIRPPWPGNTDKLEGGGGWLPCRRGGLHTVYNQLNRCMSDNKAQTTDNLCSRLNPDA